MADKITSPKYRRLTTEELEMLEKEFVYFLSAQNVTADDWSKIKATDSDRTATLLNVFSDMVFDASFEKVSYLIRSQRNVIHTVHCQTSQIMHALLTTTSQDIDLRTIDFKNKSSIDTNNKLNIRTYAESFEGNRKLILFNYIENDFLISDGQLYKRLILLAAED